MFKRHPPVAVLPALLGLLVALILPFLKSSDGKFPPLTSDLSPVLLLTAHPDDEVMFFAPTIRGLRKRDAEIKVLCLSNGNAEGLGSIREREFGDSLDVLGIGRNNGNVINDPLLKDNMTLHWDTEAILSHVRPFVAEHAVKTIITFDSHGISGHPNHISLATAVDGLLHEIKQATSSDLVLRVFHLISRNRFLKYTGPLSMPFVSLLARKSRPAAQMDVWGYFQALQAMRQHRSQLLWFRYLYVTFSRYMYINEWEELVVD